MNLPIKITDVFCYLGIPFRDNKKFSFLQKHLADPNKVWFALYSKCKHLSVNCKTMLDFFFIQVFYVIRVKCVVFVKVMMWRNYILDSFKQLSFLNTSTCNVMVYFELGCVCNII